MMKCLLFRDNQDETRCVLATSLRPLLFHLNPAEVDQYLAMILNP